MRKLAVALAALVWGGFLLPVQALTIRNDYGGRVDQYLARWQRIAQSNETVRIDGPCNSSCTLLLGTIPKSRICVTPRASLGFHRAWTRDWSGWRVEAPMGTALLWNAYPQEIRGWITAHGGLTQDIKSLSGSALRSFYRACP